MIERMLDRQAIHLENYKRKLTGAVLEKELSYNFDYLNQLFRKQPGVSIFRMPENIRMEAAKNILQARKRFNPPKDLRAGGFAQ